jgi:hypothetical protein
MGIFALLVPNRLRYSTSKLRRFHVGEYFGEEIYREPSCLLIRFLEPLPTTVVRVADNLGLTGTRVLAEEHELRLAVGLAPLNALQVLEVTPVHCKDVIEVVEV